MSKLKETISGYSNGFDTGIAMLVGTNAAVVFNHIIYWLKINARKKGVEKFEGKFWMYETQKQMADFFGYLSEDDVCRAIKKLLDEGLIIKGNFNKTSFDKTSWYTIEDQDLILNEDEIQKSLSKPRNRGIETAKSRNPNCEIAESINNVQEEHTEKKHHHQEDLIDDDSSFQEDKKTPTPSIDSKELKFTDDERERLNNYSAEQIAEAIDKTNKDCVQTRNSSRVKYFFKIVESCAKSTKKPIADENRKWAEEEKLKWLKYRNVKIEFLSKHIEFSMTNTASGCYQPTIIEYSAHGFRDQFENALRKHNCKKKNE